MKSGPLALSLSYHEIVWNEKISLEFLSIRETSGIPNIGMPLVSVYCLSNHNHFKIPYGVFYFFSRFVQIV